MHFVCLVIAKGDPLRAAEMFDGLSEEWLRYWEAYTEEVARIQKRQPK